ncbi:MAG TPA: ABC transporter permease [Ktedonobacteraceae bacterium]
MRRFSRIIWACMKKDFLTTMTERIFLVTLILIPLQYLCLFILFVLPGDAGPTAVVMQDTGPYAQQLYNAMANAHSFQLFQAPAQEAQDQLEAGHVVAVVTIPANFDTRVQNSQSVQVDVQINNLNTDFTADIRRGIPDAITLFYARAFPHLVAVTTSEDDWYTYDTGYIPYLAVSIVVLALALAGSIQSGTSWAREWELQTMKELLLSPAPRWCLITGKMLGAFFLALVSALLVLPILIGLLGVRLVHPGELVGYTIVTLALFSALGTVLGLIIKQRRLITTVTLASALPIFFVSGPLGPVTFETKPIEILAMLFPLSYAISGVQHAFEGFDTNALGGWNGAILVGFALVSLVVAVVMLRRMVTQ